MHFQVEVKSICSKFNPIVVFLNLNSLASHSHSLLTSDITADVVTLILNLTS